MAFIAKRAAAVAAGASLLAPAAASAHGLVGRTDLPIPQWMFAWVAAVVLIVSFAALASLWSEPRLQRPHERELAVIPRGVEVACGFVGVVLFDVVVYSGLRGSQVPLENLAPTFVFVIFWVGLPILSALAGDIFQLFNPWRATARAVVWVLRAIGSKPIALRRYPLGWGRWPAIAGLVAFGWLELVYADRDHPQILAALALGYAGVQLVGMALFGIERWTTRGDAFSVYFNAFSRLSPLDWGEGRLRARRVLSGATTLDLVPGTVVLLGVMIGITTFDGASNGSMWASLGPKLTSVFEDLGAGATAAAEAAGTVGLLVAILLVCGMYRVGVAGMRTVSHRFRTPELAGRFAHTLTPIALGYLVAHYFSLLVFQGQAMGFLVSDPLGDGANIFGTASLQVNYNLISAAAIWYVQVAALLAGHVAALALAHDRALVVYRRAQEAVRSQYWMLTVMVGFTCLGLWLLSAVGT